ncbi:MAG TPA: NAD(P)-binding domain-containing protein [Kouleothrix sp.]|nr:NAD(P)-binding domain-containing protein [Kouleothrix sp.]
MHSANPDTFAVIGAGFCGLGVMAALRRHGIAFEAFERDDRLGGNWYHGVYETVHIISSRKTTEYSDYPMPLNYPDFPSAAQMLTYLNSYADHHALKPHIRFNTGVEHVASAPGDRWELTLSTGERRTYAGVVIANGHHWDCRYPSYPGEFAGQIIHSKHYKNPEILKGKRVLVIGGGNSACDIAVEAARFARSAHISMRRGYWILPKTVFGRPLVESIPIMLPLWAQRLFLRAAVRVVVGRYEDYGLQRPDHRIFEHHPTINSELLAFLRHGRVTPHPDIARYAGNTVEFTDGSRADFDLIVAATGYHLSLPMLAPGVIAWRNGVPQLIGLVSPTHKNIYIFGAGQARYGAGPLISAGAETLCTMIRVQRQLRQPIGALLQKLGMQPPNTMLVGPEEVLRSTRQAQRILPALVLLEKVLG